MQKSVISQKSRRDFAASCGGYNNLKTTKKKEPLEKISRRQSCERTMVPNQEVHPQSLQDGVSNADLNILLDLYDSSDAPDSEKQVGLHILFIHSSINYFFHSFNINPPCAPTHSFIHSFIHALQHLHRRS